MTENKLLQIFKRTASLPPGECAFPEPGRGFNVPIAQPEVMKVIEPDQPVDAGDNAAERKAFKKRLLASVEAGEITEKQAKKWYKLVN